MIRSRRILASLGLVATATAIAPAAGAQSLEPVRTTDFGVTAGVGVPVGDGMGDLNTGFTLGASLGVKSVNMPMSFRFEATYARFGADEVRFTDEDGSLSADGHIGFLGGIANAILPIPTASTIRPYFIGGLGVFRVTAKAKVAFSGSGGSVSASESESQTKLGLNGGMGVEFPVRSVRAFAEARFHSVFTEDENANFIPLTVGVRF